MRPPTRRSSAARLRAPHLAFILLSAAAGCGGGIADPITGPLRSVAPAYTGPDPVIFVHGWNADASTWNTMVARLRADGYTSAQLLAWSYDTRQSNAVTAQLIATKVDSVLRATGAPHVALVSHSMGTLSARYYLKNLGGQAKVRTFVSLGGPDHGTDDALFCGDTSCREMRPNSSFLKTLNAGDETPGTVRYATWWSPCDEVIIPERSTILSGATNTRTECMEHSYLHEDIEVYRQVKAWIQVPNGGGLLASVSR